MKSKQEIHAKRPTSPHLSIYKPQISSSLSILHRMTGVGMYFGLAIICWWMIVIQFYGFCDCMALNQCLIGRLSLYAVSYASIYHFLNGIRHLFWDVGYGFSIKAVDYSGWLVFALSIKLTILFWWLVV